MTVLYRAVWSADLTAGAEQVIERLKHCVAVWSQETEHPSALVEMQTEFDVSQGRHRRIDYRAVGDAAFEVVVTDQVPGEPAEWTVKTQAVVDDSMHVLVENHMESDDLTQRITVGRPSVVHELLIASGKPGLGGSALLTERQSIPANGIDILTDLLADPRRTLPVIVCTEPGGQHSGDWLSVADQIARRAEGIAVVITLDHDAVTALKDRLGLLAIWGGGVRVYAPWPVTAESDGWRHRYYLGSVLDSARQATINRIVYSVSQLSTRRRIPTAFAVFADTGNRPVRTPESQVSIEELDAQREQYDRELEAARDEQSALQVELSAATGHLARLKDELIARGLVDVLWGTQHEDRTSIPDQVQDISEAALAAQTYLGKWLALPDSAIRELADLDSSPNGFAWGNTTWRGLRALAAYAEDRAGGWDAGGFWEWCASGPVLGWPATSKKLSMTEGETVQNSTKLARARIFDVDTRVDTSGKISMLAHLKISEGGGPLAPRVYFHDDTNGQTGMVHIGLVGPHYLVPNKSTN